MATATQRRPVAGIVVGKGESSVVKNLCATVELAASASGTTIDFGYIPANARLMGASRVYKDDLATSGSPTLDIGLIAVNSNVTSDVDAINDGIDVAGTAADVRLVKDHANTGKFAWEFVSGQTTDPGGSLLVRGVIKDAATTATGTITVDIYYSLD